MTALYHASLFSLFSIVIAAAPMVAGFAFALRPAATRLALVRALTLVGVFVTAANIHRGRDQRVALSCAAVAGHPRAARRQFYT